MGADDNWRSNLFLPLGKVRMGCPLGKVRMGYPTWNVRMGLRPRVGADSIRLVLIFCHYTCGLSWFIARYVCEVVTHPLLSTPFLSRFWASTLPKWGKHVTQQGQARCPTWAHFLLLPCPISHFFITPISSYFFPFPRQRNLPNLPSLPISSPPIIPHPLPSSSAVIKLYKIFQTAS